MIMQIPEQGTGALKDYTQHMILMTTMSGKETILKLLTYLLKLVKLMKMLLKNILALIDLKQEREF